MLNKKRYLISMILFSMIFFTLSGCSTSNFGRLESDKEIKHSFESYQVLPNHKYYYRGASSHPTAIVGIEENYVLNLKMWVQIDPESKDFRRLIDIISLQGMGNPIQPWGFRIIDHEGNEVGIWYSAIRNAAVAINEDRQIINLQPGTLVAIGDQLR